MLDAPFATKDFIKSILSLINSGVFIQKEGALHPHRVYWIRRKTYPPSPIQAVASVRVRENATMLFAAESDVFASMFAPRQQLQPFCPVETMAPPRRSIRDLNP